ncbi:MAG: cupin domain-containing protein [Kangiella sp.]|jgi:50S ribosomal protein L16 3-hydroxylase|nr:cupin domain-containing protein [Kangiella sp.]MCW9027621.1 cupin domain-containing protein [Kangiella sp.]
MTSILGDISPEQFLKEYWQKRPLLIRGAFSSAQVSGEDAFISAEELAGYSLEDDIESRLIEHDGDLWQLEHGPIEESKFAKLDDENWTLLVQSLDYFHPPLCGLIKACNFIPRWRLDDVMVSYATNGGGVGPHLDKYDVFLIQGEGQRRWRLGHKNQATTAICPHPQIAQIEPFDADMDVIVNPGDMLYIPPNTPHWGESVGNSICYSVGFRAPNIGGIVQKLLQLPQTDLDQLWSDESRLNLASIGGELSTSMSQWAKQQLQQLWTSDDYLMAFGKEVTELKYPDMLEVPDDDQLIDWVELALEQGVKAEPLARMTYFKRGGKQNNELWLFINGEWQAMHISLIPIIEKLNLTYKCSAKELATIDHEVAHSFLSFSIDLGALKPSLFEI